MIVRGLWGSIEARGKFADIMVAFTWKGIQCVRKLVYPAQPVTPLKTAQQGHMRLSQAEWHNALYTSGDNTAWTKLASLQPKGETGANQLTREYIRVARVPATWSRLRAGSDVFSAPADRQLLVEGDAGLANVNVRFGTNIRFMNTIGACAFDVPTGMWHYEIPLGTYTTGERIYYQFYDSATTIDVALGVTGIYQYDQP